MRTRLWWSNLMMILAVTSFVLSFLLSPFFLFGFFVFVGIGFWLYLHREKIVARGKTQPVRITETKTYRGFNSLQKVIFWLFPLAMLNLLFWVYFIVLYANAKNKSTAERSEYYVKGVYYFDIFWLVLVVIVVLISIVANT